MLANAVGGGLAQQFDLAVSAQTTGIMTVVLFGTGTDYVLFVSARFREELTRSQDRHEAMRNTMRGVGGAVASAGATILIASVVLLLATLKSYQALGPVIAVAVALMMLAAITLVPAVLTIVGRSAFWPARPRLSTGNEGSAAWRGSIYGRIGAVVLRRPVATLAVTGVVLALLVLGLLPFQTNYDRLASLPRDTESVQSFELLREGFPTGELSPTLVYVSLPPGERALDPVSLQRIDEITVDLAGHPRVARVSGPSRPRGADGPYGSELPEEETLRFVSDDGSAVVINAVLTVNPFSREGLSAIPELRTLARQSAADAGLPEGSVLVGGDTAEQQDTRRAGARDTWVVLPLILLAIGVVLAVLLRSLVAPLYLMATIAFTYFSTLGLAVLVFVVAMGHPGVGPGVPFFLFVFLNALSVDYNIYLMSRIREEVREAPLPEADGLCPGPHRPGDYLRRDDTGRHVFGVDGAAPPGPDATRLCGGRRRVDRHVHHADADSAGAGEAVRAVELVAVAGWGAAELGRGFEAVADLVDGLDEGAAGGLYLGAQTADVDVDGAGAAQVVVFPHLAEQGFPGIDPPGVGRQQHQQLEIPCTSVTLACRRP